MATSIEPNAVYTRQEACELLNVPASTFWALLRRGEIKGKKVGRQWRFLGSNLLDYVGGQQSAA